MPSVLTTEELHERPCACGCGTLVDPDRRGRPRRFVHGHNGRGKPLSRGHRTKISASHQGVPLSTAHRAALRGPRPRTRREGNHAWRGEEATYEAAHQWLDYHFGHEKTRCQRCGTEDGNLEWAFIGENGGYSRNREDYRVLCCSCHRTYDCAKDGAVQWLP